MCQQLDQGMEKQMSGIKNFKLVPEAPAAVALAEASKIAVVPETPAPAHDAQVAAVAAQAAAEEAQNSIMTVNFEALRADNQDYEASVGVKIITSVPVGKPGRQTFIRVHPDPAWRLQANILELKGDKTETFLLSPRLGAELADETVRVELYSAMTRQGMFFLWPVKIPGTDGRLNTWHVSALEAAQIAMEKWIRVGADMEARSYGVTQATGNFPDPVWPTSKSFQDLVRLAFKDHYIASTDHPVVRRLAGRV
jgi:hypothetical protein